MKSYFYEIKPKDAFHPISAKFSLELSSGIIALINVIYFSTMDQKRVLIAANELLASDDIIISTSERNAIAKPHSNKKTHKQDRQPQAEEDEDRTDNQEDESFFCNEHKQERKTLLGPSRAFSEDPSLRTRAWKGFPWIKSGIRALARKNGHRVHPTSSTEVPVQKILDRQVGSLYLYLSVLIVLLSGSQLGWEITQLNLSTFHSQDDCARRPIQDGKCIIFPGHSKWVVAVVSWVVGAALGSLSASSPGDQFGRRFVILMNAILMVLGAALQTFAPAISVFSLGRFFSGVCSGSATTIASIFLAEIGPEHQRASFVVAFQVAGSLGLVAITSAHFAVSGSATSWRWIMMVPMCLGGIQLLFMPFFLVESPTWLLRKHKVQDAAVAYSRLYRGGSFEKLQAQVRAEQEASRQLESSHQMNAFQSLAAFFKESTSSRNRTQFYLSILLCIARQFGGVSAVFYYSSSIFTRAGIPDPRVGNLILSMFNVSTVFTVCTFMKHIPRRKALLFGISGMIFASIGMTLALIRQSMVAIAFTAMYVTCNSMSLGTLPFLVSAEVLPEHIRSKGLSISSCVNWVANLCIGIAFPSIAQALGNYAFTPFTILLVFFWIILYSFLPETKSRSSEDIQLGFLESKRSFLRQPKQVGSVCDSKLEAGDGNFIVQHLAKFRRASLEMIQVSIPSISQSA
uniref:Hexose transporter 1 n=1 Tax=Albugo laibachii Nc14 TaxID=890382 RepID=F0WWR1_9STRA|nr:glucose transporter putative [Albugo laibachii Nc14]|eukprot:CCA25888.1 glucose transporter putative [Albugo laibachii Nc14]